MKRIEKVIKNLAKNNTAGYYVERKEEVVPLLKTLIKEGDTVAVGGSMSLFECKVIDMLRQGNYNFLDRYKQGLTRKEIDEIYIESFSADVYLTSSNAVTESGELYNVDGTSNRIAAIGYGPKSVIIVVGRNKIVKDIEEAIIRVKTIVAPKNAQRLGAKSYCESKNQCCITYSDFAGCYSDGRICSNYLICSYQQKKDRIKVIITGENIGY